MSRPADAAGATPPGPPDFFDRDALARFLGVSTRTVDRLAAGSKLPAARRIGARKRWPRAEIEEWVRLGCPPCPGHQPGRRGRA